MTEADWTDFTEAAFVGHLRALKSGGYRFIRYGEQATGRQVLWRHDVDCSMHRAAKLAALEAAEGVFATYFLHPGSRYYNLAEPAVLDLIGRIADAGHEIGLHFEGDVRGGGRWTRDELDKAVTRERTLLELIAGHPIRVLSWHDPEAAGLLDFGQDQIGGLVNAYADSIRGRFTYASDSNGYWRFKPMAEVIAEGHERLHLLTHPEWWTPEPLAPFDRIDRCIDGRATQMRRLYRTGLAKAGRMNIGQAPETGPTS